MREGGTVPHVTCVLQWRKGGGSELSCRTGPSASVVVWRCQAPSELRRGCNAVARWGAEVTHCEALWAGCLQRIGLLPSECFMRMRPGLCDAVSMIYCVVLSYVLCLLPRHHRSLYTETGLGLPHCRRPGTAMRGCVTVPHLLVANVCCPVDSFGPTDGEGASPRRGRVRSGRAAFN